MKVKYNKVGHFDLGIAIVGKSEGKIEEILVKIIYYTHKVVIPTKDWIKKMMKRLIELKIQLVKNMATKGHDTLISVIYVCLMTAYYNQVLYQESGIVKKQNTLAEKGIKIVQDLKNYQ